MVMIIVLGLPLYSVLCALYPVQLPVQAGLAGPVAQKSQMTGRFYHSVRPYRKSNRPYWLRLCSGALRAGACESQPEFGE